MHVFFLLTRHIYLQAHRLLINILEKFLPLMVLLYHLTNNLQDSIIIGSCMWQTQEHYAFLILLDGSNLLILLHLACYFQVILLEQG